jgi:hypothetical protein
LRTDTLDRRAGETRPEGGIVEAGKFGQQRCRRPLARRIGGVGRLRELVPGADRQAIVAAIDAVANQGAHLARDRPLQFDGQIGNAAPGVELIRCREGRCGADVETAPAGTAMVALGLVGRQLQRGENSAEEEPRAHTARHQVGVLALPAQPGRLSQRLLHDRGGIDEDLDLAALLLDQPAPQPLQPLLDHVVIVAALGVDADRGPVRLRQNCQRVASGGVGGRVGLGQHDDRTGFGPQSFGAGPPADSVGHPGHVAMPPLPDPLAQPRARHPDRVRAGDANLGEAERPSLRLKLGADRRARFLFRGCVQAPAPGCAPGMEEPGPCLSPIRAG